MKITRFICLLIFLCAASVAGAATLEWTGAVNSNITNDGNWSGGSSVGILDATLAHDLVFVNAGVAPVGPERTLQPSWGVSGANSITVDGVFLDTAGNDGISAGTIHILHGGSARIFFMKSTIHVDATSSLNLLGGGDPLPSGSVLNLAPGAQLAMASLGEFTEQGAQIFVDGTSYAADDTILSFSGNTATAVGVPSPSDTDEDGLVDSWEQLHFGNLDQVAAGDPDGDLLDNAGEQSRETDPNLQDTDGDGFNDKIESGTGVWIGSQDTGTSAIISDTDEDGLPDGVETRTGTFVSGQDTGTDPHLFNTDGDRIGDGSEVARGTNPNDAGSQPNLPNVVFIMADDLGYNHLSSYGQTRLATPNIDSLATDGMRFTDAYAGCTVCGPSRSSLMTGLHSGHIPYKLNDAHVDITDRTGTLGELFKEAGFMTGAFGKWGIGGLGSGQTPNERGIDEFYGMLDQGHGHRHFPSYLIGNNVKSLTGNTVDSGGNTSANPADRVQHTHDAFTAHALQFIEDQQDRAFFCYLAFTLPHTEIIASDAVLNTPEFDPSLWPETYTADTSIHISQNQPHRNFGAELRMIDNSVGAIIAKLDELGLTDNTLLVFTSDNGGQEQSVWGNAPSIYFNANGILRGGKTDSYEGGLRVPMLAKWPSHVPAGTTSDLPCYFADFYPTVAQVLGVRPPAYVDGLSILPELTGDRDNQKKHRYLFWSHQAGSLDHAVRAGKWKAVKRGGNAIELYNLETDPSETSNVAGSNAAIVQEMQRIITREYVPDLGASEPSASSPVYPNHP